MKRVILFLILLSTLEVNAQFNPLFNQVMSESAGALELVWDDIANTPVADSTSVADWNTFFDLPTNGTPFTSVTVAGNVVYLYGGSGITLYESIFDDVAEAGTHLVSIVDNALCVVAAEYDAFGADNNSGCISLVTVELNALITAGELCFGYAEALTNVSMTACTTCDIDVFNGCISLDNVNLISLVTSGQNLMFGCSSLINLSLPSLEIVGTGAFGNCTLLEIVTLHSLLTIGDLSFQNCTSIITIDIPLCTSLGGTTGDDNVFNGITAQTITVTCPAALLTCNGGAPDGDLLYLMANNTVTINGVGALILGWDDIANVPVADSTSVSDWNTFFDLPTNGTPFTSVTVAGNVVYLYGGSGITLYESIFDDVAEAGTHLVSIVDNALCIVAAEYDAFGDDNNSGCPALVTVELNACLTVGDFCFASTPITSLGLLSATIMGENALQETQSTSYNFPLLLTIGSNCFSVCTAMTVLNIPSCTTLGATTGNDNVFDFITAQTITVTCPAALLTCNGGAPDGDLCYLNANNTITVNGAPLVGCP